MDYALNLFGAALGGILLALRIVELSNALAIIAMLYGVRPSSP
jgi:hypothetical protein